MNSRTARDVASSILERASVEGMLSPASVRHILRRVRKLSQPGEKMMLRGYAAGLVTKTAKSSNDKLDRELKHWDVAPKGGNSHMRLTKRYRDAIKPIMVKLGVSWKSKHGLTAKQVTSKRLAREIVSRVFHDERLQQEIDAAFIAIGESAGPKLKQKKIWDAYFEAYDKIVAYSSGYNKLMADAHRALPTKGLIVDYGTGSGNFAAVLQAGRGTRTVLGVDISPAGLNLGEKKVAAYKPNARSKVSLQRTDLTDAAPVDGLKPGTVKGAVMNNVLYALGKLPAKKAVLRRVFKDLAPGGVLVLSDPTSLVQKSEAHLQKMMSSVVESAVGHKSPCTAFDIAFVARVNHKALVGEAPPFLTAKQLGNLARSVGFVVEMAKPAYNGVSNFLVLRKP